ncbi:hypothetical protein RHOSPDRAFT_30811 [Rhodotorula sp. JG-1b]|nr:hypothetical protein RHOSPDRAFT_30811 [Rhodotorula sp. JG-1b]
MTANRDTTFSEVQQIPRPTPAVLRACYVERGLPPLPAHVSIPISGEANSIIGAERRGSTTSWDDLALSPPPYRSNPARTAVGPLSFFPFAPMESSPLATTDDHEAHLLRSRFSHTSSTMAPPPSYAETPRTQAERLFWFGWIFPPFLWLFGASRIWRTENLHGIDIKKGTLSTPFDEGEGSANVRESLELWREEELVWARRCLWALIGSLMLGTLLGVMLASVTGKL